MRTLLKYFILFILILKALHSFENPLTTKYQVNFMIKTKILFKNSIPRSANNKLQQFTRTQCHFNIKYYNRLHAFRTMLYVDAKAYVCVR